MALTKQPSPEAAKEVVQPVRTLRTSAVCFAKSENGPCDGSLEHDGYSVPLMTPLGPAAEGRKLHRHACSKCGRPAWLGSVYPQLSYTPLDELDAV